MVQREVVKRGERDKREREREREGERDLKHVNSEWVTSNNGDDREMKKIMQRNKRCMINIFQMHEIISNGILFFSFSFHLNPKHHTPYSTKSVLVMMGTSTFIFFIIILLISCTSPILGADDSPQGK